MTDLKKYRIYCSTEDKYNYVWDTVAPSLCPYDIGDTVVSASINSVNTVFNYKTYTNLATNPELRGYNFVRLDATGGIINLKLPPVSTNINRVIIVQRLDTGLDNHAVNIVPHGSDTIDSNPTNYSLTGHLANTITTTAIVKLQASGINWAIIDTYSNIGELDGELEGHIYNDNYITNANDTEMVVYGGDNNQYANFKLYTKKLVDPAPSNDLNEGYSIGSRWLNTVTDKEFICFDISAGAAIWYKTNDTQNVTSVGVHETAGLIDQGQYSVAVGYNAGNSSQGEATIAIGKDAGATSQGGTGPFTGSAIAIGNTAGQTNQGVETIAIGSGAGNNLQGDTGIAIGLNAGAVSQTVAAIAIGGNAGNTSQGFSAIAIGVNSGNYFQLNEAIAIGIDAGNTSQGAKCVALGYVAGNIEQGGIGPSLGPAIAIGEGAGYSSQKGYTVAVGYNAGNISQNIESIAIGREAGSTLQDESCIAVGRNAGKLNQSLSAIAIGADAGLTSQGAKCVALGFSAGNTGQGGTGKSVGPSIAIGDGAGSINQNGYAIAIGSNAANNTQNVYSIAIGNNAGNTSQGGDSIAIGFEAGKTSQDSISISIGSSAGNISQNTDAVAIGASAGMTSQSAFSISIGGNAGKTTQGTYSVAMGNTAGETTQGARSVAIGSSSGRLNQGIEAVAIGFTAGVSNQGADAVAIGYGAGSVNQPANTIAIGAGANPTTTNMLGLGFNGINPVVTTDLVVNKLPIVINTFAVNNILLDKGLFIYGSSAVETKTGFVKTSGTNVAATVRCEYAKTVPPASTDDINAGYEVGSRWIDITADKEYVCVDATGLSAIWQLSTSSGSGAFTAGSVIFSNGSVLAEDNAKFFWDDTNNRLGIGNNAPTVPLHVTGAAKITGALDMSSQLINNLANPVLATDAANKYYVDAVVNGLDVKLSCKVATVGTLDANTSITAPAIYTNTAGPNSRGQIVATLDAINTFIVDGVTLTSSNNNARVLIKDQANAAENGIYTITISGTTLTLDRAIDFDDVPEDEVHPSAFTFIEEGTVNGDNGWVMVTNEPIEIGGIGGAANNWVQFSGAGQINAGDALSKTGNTLNVNVDTVSIEINGSDQLALTGRPTTKGDILSYSTGQASLPVGTNRQVLVADSTATFGIKWSSVPFYYWVIVDSKSTAVNGGTGTITAWTDRVLNTKLVDGGTDVSLASNTLTLTAGDYIVRARAPFYGVTGARIRLQNITTPGTEVSSQNVWATYEANAELSTKISITSSTDYKVQYYIQATQGSNDLGNALGISGENEIYTIVEITKI